MRICTIVYNGMEQAAILRDEDLILVTDINDAFQTEFPVTLLQLLAQGQLDVLRQLYVSRSMAHLPTLHIHSNQLQMPYREAHHIFGVGMNYVEKLEDLQAERAEEPVIFMKPTSSMISEGDAIRLPTTAEEVSAEGELALIIGKACTNVSEADALNYIAAYTTSLDMTARDIHAKNPRFMQISKVFPTFFSFGPVLTTTDEVEDIAMLTVQSVHNGQVIHENSIAHMMYSPAYIVSYLSTFVTLQPGDIIMTGTPGSFIVQSGDVASCVISGLPILQNKVV